MLVLARVSSADLLIFGSGSLACCTNLVRTKFCHCPCVVGKSKLYCPKCFFKYFSAASHGALVNFTPSCAVFSAHFLSSSVGSKGKSAG